MEKKKKKKRGCLIVLIILLVLIAAGGIWFWRITTDPASLFRNAPTAVPSSNVTATVAPIATAG